SETATKLLALSLDTKAEGAPGTFEGYGAIFGNKDRDGDIVVRGAFAESLKAGMPALLWQHDQKAPIGKFDEVRKDDKGLFVKGRLAMTGKGLEAYELLKIGALDGLSIGFVTKEATRDPATKTRTISQADLMEISLVTFPANELARVSTVKAAHFDKKDADMPGTDMLDTNVPETGVNTARSFERMLRENGFSRSRAKTITAKGFKATDFAADETAEIAEMVTELKERQVLLESKKGKGGSGNQDKLEAIEKIVKLIYTTYKKVVPTSGTIQLREGGSKKFHFGYKSFLRSSTKVKVVMPNPGFHHFTCKLVYWKWGSNGPVEQGQELYFDGRRANLDTILRTGLPTDSKAWFGRVFEKEGFDGLRGRLENFLSNPIPECELIYHKFFLKDPEVARGMEKGAKTFKVIAR
ncbi:MAG: HK97 family phage prohead protease, partial [Kordiimonadaceae bacterium]|nr:HK97 family phage prohead protease [Kordiimonadaceae bacterium]